MSYGVYFTINDNECAIFQLKISGFLHKCDGEWQVFSVTKDKSKYYSFNTPEEAQTWFLSWYGIRKLAPNNQPVPMPNRDCFKVMEIL